MGFKKMKKAYNASAKIMEKRMEKERPEDFQILKKVSKSSIVIVKGTYDKVELVLDLINIPYLLIDSNQFNQIELNPNQILIINCPGNGMEESLTKIKDFVKQGGFLFTTDWALSTILEQIFPDFLKYNQRPTQDDCVAVEIVDKNNKFLEGIFKADEKPIWWLESSSYPIQILDPKKVQILVKSEEMKQKYGQDPIVITFNYGDGGTVLHMTSHYYLQRSELRTNRHMKSAADYAMEEMAFSKEEVMEIEKELDGVSLGEAESAYSTTQFLGNVIIEQQKKVNKRLTKKKSVENKESK